MCKARVIKCIFFNFFQPRARRESDFTEFSAALKRAAPDAQDVFMQVYFLDTSSVKAKNIERGDVFRYIVYLSVLQLNHLSGYLVGQHAFWSVVIGPGHNCIFRKCFAPDTLETCGKNCLLDVRFIKRKLLNSLHSIRNANGT